MPPAAYSAAPPLIFSPDRKKTLKPFLPICVLIGRLERGSRSLLPARPKSMKRQPPTPRSATEHAAHPVRHAVALAKAGPPLARQAPIPHSALGLPHSFTSTHPKTCPAFVIRPFASSQLSTFSAFWPRTTASNPCLSAACKLADGKVRKFHFCPRSSSLYLAIPLGFREEGLGALAFSPRHRSLFLLNRSGDSRETPEPKSLLKVYRFFTIFQKMSLSPHPSFSCKALNSKRLRKNGTSLSPF